MAIPIKDSFEVEASIAQVWDYFSNPTQVVPCLPGAELLATLEDGAYEGRVKVQVGPVRAQFSGTVRILEIDPESRTMTLSGRGNQEGAAGRAEATVHFGLEPMGPSATQVHIEAEVAISGMLAQLGGGMIQTVARQLFRRFAGCARREILARVAG